MGFGGHPLADLDELRARGENGSATLLKLGSKSRECWANRARMIAFVWSNFAVLRGLFPRKVDMREKHRAIMVLAQLATWIVLFSVESTLANHSA